MTKWLNRTLVQLARNASTTFTINHTAASSGNLLVTVIEAPAVITTPTGYTKQAEALNNTHFAVYTKTATAGESSFGLTLSAANYPAAVLVYEFASGSTFVGVNSATNQPTTGTANPSVGGLTGTNLGMAGYAGDLTSGSASFNFTWASPASVVDTQVTAAFSTTDGYVMSVAYAEDLTATSYAPVPTSNFTVGTVSATERLTWVVNAAVSGDASVTAVKASGSALAVAPTVSNGAANQSVSAVKAAASALAQAPAVDGETVVSGGGAAVATALARPPVVTATSSGAPTILPPAAVVAARAFAAVVSGQQFATVTATGAVVTVRAGVAHAVASLPNGSIPPSATWNTKRVFVVYRNIFTRAMEAGTWSAVADERIINTLADGTRQVFRPGRVAAGNLNTSEGLPSLDVDIPIVDDPDNSPPGGTITLTITFASGGSEVFRLAPLQSWSDAGTDLALLPTN